MNPVRGHIDFPRPDDILRAYRVPVSGWVYLGEGQQDNLAAVRVTGPGGACLGRTRLFYHRPDVEAQLGVDRCGPVGFELHAALPPGLCPGGGTFELGIELELHSGDAPIAWRTTRFALRADDVLDRPHGHALLPAAEELLHRDDVYLMGPSSQAVNGEILALLLRYLPAAGRVLDVGCGVGPFGALLIEHGFDWFGVEVKDEDCWEMVYAGLPHQQVVPGEPLPFADMAFDGGMCIEVLEHIPQPDSFLAEISRVVRGRTIFSVPNFELVPLLGHNHVAPRHILEPDHKNFFTRFSLGALLRRHFRAAEILDYARLPLEVYNGEILPYHLLGIADNTP